ncbi:TlpA family protein disulfide reductase [Marinigracilibium pacificum]|uniref:TlpA family protein disulfide reductase n=1 Tax=Marinigracilibium pacificum TaxID=2729599 RepID=A0A848J3L1_9BACT|nr:TlpA disulfide reductase family protein [Marinigracilibium pacificum]NMM47762.1 TlpA family protein disulfide reductase [Marinigracilibium pacificum]
MKKLFLLFLVVLSIACEKPSEVDYVLLSGKIENAESDKVLILGYDFRKVISVADDGTFNDTLRINYEGYFDLKIDEEKALLYLSNGADINLQTDYEAFDDSLTFTGKGAEENNYLAEKVKTVSKPTYEYAVFYSQPENEFKNQVESIKENSLNLVNNYEGVSEDFVKVEEANIGYEYHNYLSSYPIYYKMFTQSDSLELADGFYSENESFNYTDEKAFKTSPIYRDLVIKHYATELNNYTISNNDNYHLGFIELINTMPKGIVKEEFMHTMAFGMLKPNEYLEKTYSLYLENTSREDYLKEYKEKYDSFKSLTEDRPSPNFEFENYEGGKTTLESLRGKYVYIDVWATWCGPCIKEIPELTKLQEQYADKNISFVSISVDSKDDYETWKNMVKDKNLGGIQLFADNGFQSDFMEAYVVEAIPRFILIGPDGNIVKADAPRPSDEELLKLFNDLNI